MFKRTGLGLLTATASLLVPLCAGASAYPATTTIQVVDSSSDAPLSANGKTAHVCESTDPSHGCTLRAAVELADIVSVEAGTATIIDVPAAKFTNTAANGGTLTVLTGARVTIVGAGAGESILDGGGVGSVLTVEGNAELTVEGVTIRNGRASNGGGIYTSGFAALNVRRSMIVDNTASADGGGIFSQNADGLHPVVVLPSDTGARPQAPFFLGSELTIEQSTIAHNSAAKNGGGIFEAPLLDAILNTTITDNQAGEYGGGIYAETVSDTLADDTLLDNIAGVAASGNLVGTNDAEVSLHETIIAEPPGSAGPGCASAEGGQEPPVPSQSVNYNLDYPSTVPGTGEVDACGLSSEMTNDMVGVDPRLDPAGLKDNGGPTETVALLGPATGTPSPAIDAVPQAECGEPIIEIDTPVTITPIAVDQRGSARPDPGGTGTNCDIGAYEYSPTEVIPTCTTPPSVTPGQQVTIVCTVEKRNGLYATGTTTQFTLPAGATLVSTTPSQGTCSGTSCRLGTIDPATVTIVMIPTASGPLPFSASDAETGSKATSVNVTVLQPAVQPTVQLAAQCTSLRHFKIHIQNVKQLKIVSAIVYVNGRHRQVLRGKALTANIDLRKLPKGRFVVKIVARTRGGKKLTGQRSYHTCVARRPGHKHLFL